jgi:trehalose-phosphatase
MAGASGGLPDELWDRLARAPARLLGVDYDGTLAPLRVARHLARPVPGAAQSLRAIAELPATRVAVVSGRPVLELAALLFDGRPPGAVELVGEHGWERLVAGRTRTAPLVAGARQALERCWRAALERGWSASLERKRTAVVLHTRGLEPLGARQLEEDAARLWEGLAAAGELRLDRIDGGVEVRCAARDKAAAIAELAAEAASDALVVYVGDDVTDEDAFEALRGRGIGLRVAREVRPTAAAGSFPSCEAFAEWLARWPQEIPARAAGGRP